MRSALVAAVVATLVSGGGGALAASYISGRSIRPHSIPLNRLAKLPAAKGCQLHLAYVVGQEYVVQPGSTGFGLALCPRGEVAVSGGFAIEAEVNASQVVGLTSEPMSADAGWTAGFQDTGTTPATVVAYSLCAAGTAVVAS
jgi:hypothetical protein